MSSYNKDGGALQILKSFVSLIYNIGLFFWGIIVWIAKKTKEYYWPRKKRFVVDLFIVVVFAATVVAGTEIHNEKVADSVTQELINEIAQYATFKRSIDRAKAEKSAREFMNTGTAPWLQEESIRTIIEETRRAGMPNDEIATLLATADRESGFNPFAKARVTKKRKVATACGLFQFISDTGPKYGLNSRNCMDPRANTRAEIKHFREILGVMNKKGELEGLTGLDRVTVMFPGSYCRHHDGIRATSCSQIADATAMRGMKLARQSYKALENADQKREHAPGFHERVWGVVARSFDNVRGFSSWITSPVSRFLTSIGLGNPNGSSVEEFLALVRIKREQQQEQ